MHTHALPQTLLQTHEQTHTGSIHDSAAFCIVGVGCLSVLPIVADFLRSGKGRSLTAAKRVWFGIWFCHVWGFIDVAVVTILKLLPSSKSLSPISPSLFSTPQVFQKCTVKDVGTKNLVEPTPRIEPQIKELRPGALLPLKEKKVKYISPCSCPPNCLPLPTVWYTRWLYLNLSTTFAPLLWLERNL